MKNDTYPLRDSRTSRSKLLAVAAFLVVVGAITSADALGTPGGGQEQKKAQEFSVPFGLPQDMFGALVPVDNLMTPEKVELGRKLFFDKRLSADRTVSCATCHDPASALVTGDPVAIGIRSQKTARNAPTVFNSMFNESQFWDGRAASLEDQAKLPIINSLEMGMKDHAEAVARVKEIPEYAPEFRKVFGGEGITIENIAKAIAAFERTMLSGNAPFDRFIAGDKNAMSPAAQRGWELFNGKARCISCHTWNPSSPFFSDFKFHNVGVAAKDQNFDRLAREALKIAESSADAEAAIDELALREGFSELGRFLITRQPRDIGAFKTPMLRDIELTAPYFHNGSEKTLLDVVTFYNDGGEVNPNLDGGIRKLGLTDQEKADVVEFLKALTSDDVRRGMQGLKPQTRDPVR
jgi:cytochrome c peroxidase